MPIFNSPTRQEKRPHVEEEKQEMLKLRMKKQNSISFYRARTNCKQIRNR
jgi:hypothetical protein